MSGEDPDVAGSFILCHSLSENGTVEAVTSWWSAWRRMMGPRGDDSRREIPWQRDLEKRRSGVPGVEAGLLREQGGERPRARLKDHAEASR